MGAIHGHHGLVMASATGGGGGGPNPDFASVVSLLHFDAADGSTTMTDQKGKAWAVAGNAQIDTAQSKFGGSSLLLDGTGDYLTCTHADFAFGTADFTIEMWLQLNSLSGNQYLLDIGTNGTVLNFQYGRIIYYDSSVGIAGNLYNGGPTLALGTFYHIAASRQAGTIRAFCNGVKWGDQTGPTAKASSNASIGRYGGGGYTLNGWLDDVRITNGVGRYTANFTPPTAPFADS